MKVDTQTLLIGGALAVGAYMMLKPPAVATALPSPYNPYGYPQQPQTAQQMLQQQQGGANSTASIIAGAGSALGSILNGISNFF